MPQQLPVLIWTIPTDGEFELWALDPIPPNSAHECHTRASSITLAGLLNALDGIEASEGRLLFATTNHKEALDPALRRPGRMDVHVEFGMASQYQAKQLFKRFYPEHEYRDVVPSGQQPFPTPSSPSNSSRPVSRQASIRSHASGLTDDAAPSAAEEMAELDTSRLPASPAVYQDPLPAPPRKMLGHDIESLASHFASVIPERSCTMAMLQEYLMSYKRDPLGASQEETVKDFLRRVEPTQLAEGGSGKSSRGVSIEKDSDTVPGIVQTSMLDDEVDAVLEEASS